MPPGEGEGGLAGEDIESRVCHPRQRQARPKGGTPGSPGGESSFVVLVPSCGTLWQGRNTFRGAVWYSSRGLDHPGEIVISPPFKTK